MPELTVEHRLDVVDKESGSLSWGQEEGARSPLEKPVSLTLHRRLAGALTIDSQPNQLRRALGAGAVRFDQQVTIIHAGRFGRDIAVRRI